MDKPVDETEPELEPRGEAAAAMDPAEAGDDVLTAEEWEALAALLDEEPARANP